MKVTDIKAIVIEVLMDLNIIEAVPENLARYVTIDIKESVDPIIIE